jgi:hypothetical protein
MSSEAELPRVEYEDINSGQGTLNKDLSAKESSKTGIEFLPGDVLYGKLRPYLMNWLYPQFRGIAVGDFWVLRPNDTDSSEIPQGRGVRLCPMRCIILTVSNTYIDAGGYAHE